MAVKLTEVSAGVKKWEANESYAELELNQVAFPFTGRIEAQTPLTDADGFIGEVGMILVVDKWNKNGTKNDPVVRPMKASGEDDCPLFAMNYSTELVYDERKPALRFFHQKRGTYNYDWLGNGANDDIYPRLGYLSVGDRFTLSAITIDENAADLKTTGEWDTTKIETALTAYEGETFAAGTDGYWVKTAVGDAVGPVIRVIDPMIGMPDGSYGFKVEVIKA